MADSTHQLPPGLGTLLDEGVDVTTLPGLEDYARVIVISRHTLLDEERDRLAGHFWRNLNTWLAGEDVEGRRLEPSRPRIQHAMWMVEGLINLETADRFEAALPEELRAECWERIMELRGPLGGGEERP
jgi:hypothetical protein